MIKALTLIRATFGPRFSERELRKMNFRGTLGRHAGCWVNGACHDPDCVMAEHDGQPRAEERQEPAVLGEGETWVRACKR